VTVRLALAGDTMLGRQVGDRLREAGPRSLFSGGLLDVVGEADLVVVNLECAVSDRGDRWAEPGKRFFFRAPPVAVEALQELGVDCVTLANNHALDYGVDALLDTLDLLAGAGIATVGAGPDVDAARDPRVLERAGLRLGVIGATDHPRSYSAGPQRPGVAYADLEEGVPDWLVDSVRGVEADAVLVTPHWGPNMTREPPAHVRRAARVLSDAGATLVAGHSAHVFHGVAGTVLYDLGDFIDDYAVDPRLHNDLGLLFIVTFDGPVPIRLEAVPLALDHCFTRLADGDDAAWITERFRSACAALGTEVRLSGGRLVVDWDPQVSPPRAPR
jgi:poly-gamma-glutamate capsule biosynthesis protein CapA/YwtB (metallophosphatase superfamily)